MSELSQPDDADSGISFPIAALADMLQEQPDRLDAMEIFSEWLGTIIPVEMVAYWNPQRKLNRLLCNAVDSDREALLRSANAIMTGPLPRIRHWRQRQWLFHLWLGPPLDRWDRLLIVERGTGMTVEASNTLMIAALKVLHPAMHPGRNHAPDRRREHRL